MKDKLLCATLLIIIAVTITADGGSAIWFPLGIVGLMVAGGLIYISRKGGTSS